jgi:flagellar FliL protein
MSSENAAPAKGGKGGIIVWILMALVAAGAGAAVPWIMGAPKIDAHGDEKPKKKSDHAPVKQAALPFGEVMVNLGDERLNRYLRVKLLVAVEEPDSNEITELLNKQKAFLKSWLIGYLSDHSSHEVSRKIGVNRIRREIRDQFNAMLFPGGDEKIVDILFDEFVVQ